MRVVNGVRFRAGRRLWTKQEDATLRRRYPDTPTAAIARDLNRPVSSVYQRAAKFGLSKSEAFWASPASGRTNGRQGIGLRFPKGHVPANKGLRRPGWAPGRMRETQFKPGERRGVSAKNWRPIGTVLTDPEGYQRIKVREATPGEAYGFGNTRVWPLLQRHVWAQAHGPIQPGHAICFKDGNRKNCALENLELLTRRELMARNTVQNLPKPLKQTIHALGVLRRRIRTKEREAYAAHD